MIQYRKHNMKVFQSALCLTTSAVIETGEAIVLTDPNWLPHEVEQIKNDVDAITHDERQLYIIYTHSDFDHIIGSGAFPNAKVIASRELSENPHKRDCMQEIKAFDQSYYLHRNYQPVYPKVDEVIFEDGQQINVGNSTLTFYKAPGHTHDSLFTVIEPYGIFLTGDYLSDVEFPFINSSYTDYLKTMEKAEMILAKHDISVQIPGHGHTTERMEEMRNRLAFSKEYLRRLRHDPDNMEETLRKTYAFFEGMKGDHERNREMVLRER